MFLISLISALLWASLAYGQGYIELRDEGAIQGKVQKLDCVGAGVSCAKSGSTGTLTIPGGGAGGAPVGAQYWTGAADGTLTSEKDLSALTTALVINISGVPSAYTGTTCTNQVLRLLSSVGAGTCVTITSSYVDTSIWTGTASSGLLKASSQGVLTQAVAGTDYIAQAYSTIQKDTLVLPQRNTLVFSGKGITCYDLNSQTVCSVPPTTSLSKPNALLIAASMRNRTLTSQGGLK